MLAPQMEPARQTFDPAGAGALLITGTAAGTGAGALIGWAAGSVGYSYPYGPNNFTGPNVTYGGEAWRVDQLHTTTRPYDRESRGVKEMGKRWTHPPSLFA